MKRKHIVHLGITGFPFGSAAVNHSIFIAKSMADLGCDILFINNKAIHGKNIPVKLHKYGDVENMHYCYTTLSPYKQSNFLIRNFDKVYGRVHELFLLISLRLQGKLHGAMVYLPTNSFFSLLIYWLLFSVLRVPIALTQTEFFSGFTNHATALQKLSDVLFDRYSYYFVNGYLLISEFLIEKVFQGRPQKPYVKVPPLVDPAIFNNLPTEKQKGFVFCASIAYFEVIEFAISAFEELDNSEYTLTLIVNGSEAALQQLHSRIAKSSKKNLLIHKSNLPYNELLTLYKTAAALLIPLRNTVQDSARFPQKIAEYTASGSVIITTNFGEIQYLFKDKVNALVADTYDATAIARKMEYVIEHPDEVAGIAAKASEICTHNFDYRAYGPKLIDLFEKF